VPTSITRMELLERKAQLAIAQQGRDLLEQKKTALLKELMRVTGVVVERIEELQESAERAALSLARAEALAGSELVRSAAMAAGDVLNINIETTNIMGVKVPHIEKQSARRPVTERGYSIAGTSITIDEAAGEFEEEGEAILRLADSELRLIRLSKEFQNTSRRLNALDHVLIPRLKKERDQIQNALDERERSDRFRLMLVKRAVERKRVS